MDTPAFLAPLNLPPRDAHDLVGAENGVRKGNCPRKNSCTRFAKYVSQEHLRSTWLGRTLPAARGITPVAGGLRRIVQPPDERGRI